MPDSESDLDKWLEGANLDDHFFGEALDAATQKWECDLDGSPYEDKRKQFLWRLVQFDRLGKVQNKFAALCEAILAVKDKGDFEMVKTLVNEFRGDVLKGVIYGNLAEDPFFSVQVDPLANVAPLYNKYYQDRVNKLLECIASYEQGLPEPEKKKKNAAPVDLETLIWKRELAEVQNSIDGFRILVDRMTGLTKFEQRFVELLCDSEDDGTVKLDEMGFDEELQGYSPNVRLKPGVLVNMSKPLNAKFESVYGMHFSFASKNIMKLNFRDMSKLLKEVKPKRKLSPGSKKGGTPSKRISHGSNGSSPFKFDLEARHESEDWQSYVLGTGDPKEMVKRMYEQLYCEDQRFHVIWEKLLETRSVNFEYILNQSTFQASDTKLNQQQVYAAVQAIEKLCQDTFDFVPFYYEGGEPPRGIHLKGDDVLKREKAPLRERWQGVSVAVGASGKTGSGEALNLIDPQKKPRFQPEPAPYQPKPKPEVHSFFEETEASLRLPESGESVLVLKDLFEHLRKHEAVTWNSNQRVLLGELRSRESMTVTECGKCDIKKHNKNTLENTIWKEIEVINNRFKKHFDFELITFETDTYAIDYEVVSNYFESQKGTATLYQPDVIELETETIDHLGSEDPEIDTAEALIDQPAAVEESQPELDVKVEVKKLSALKKIHQRIKTQRSWRPVEKAIITYLVTFVDKAQIDPNELAEYVTLFAGQKVSGRKIRDFIPQVNKLLGANLVSGDRSGILIDVHFSVEEKLFISERQSILIAEFEAKKGVAPLEELSTKLESSTDTLSEPIETIAQNVEALDLPGNRKILVDLFLQNPGVLCSFDEIKESINDYLNFRGEKTEMVKQDLYNLINLINKQYQARFGKILIDSIRGQGYFVGALNARSLKRLSQSNAKEVAPEEVIWECGSVQYVEGEEVLAAQTKQFLQILIEKKRDETPSGKVSVLDIADAVFGERENVKGIYDLWIDFSKRIKNKEDRFIQSEKRGTDANYWIWQEPEAFESMFESLIEAEEDDLLVFEPSSELAEVSASNSISSLSYEPQISSDSDPTDDEEVLGNSSGEEEEAVSSPVVEEIDVTGLDTSEVKEGMSRKMKILQVCISNSGNITTQQIVALGYAKSPAAVSVHQSAINTVYKTISDASDSLIFTKKGKLYRRDGVELEILEKLKASM